MNKYLVTILILALILCSVFGGIVVADATTTNSASDIHLINPSSTAVIGDTLYIADNVTDNSCVVLSFDISGSTPTYNGMQEYEGNICIMRAYNDILYILFEDKYLEWNGTSTISYSVSIQDIAILSYEDTTYKYTISDNTVYRDGVDKWQADSLVIIDYTLYLLYDGTSASLTLVSGNSVNEPNTAGYTDSTYSYMTTNGTILAYSSSNSVLVDTTAVDTQLDNINSVILHGDDVLVLHNNQLTQYTLAEGIYSQGYTIGSDTVSIDVPSLDDITGYTLVQSTGYPTNIVYKTTYSTSIASLIELDSQTVLILEYEGSQDNSYYYVYTDNGFGWIKKATTTLAEEGTLSIIDTSLNTTTNYTAKLISANGVTIYHLPDTDYVRDSFTQSVDAPTTVTLLHQYTDSASTVWYYISYDNGDGTQYGYVTSGDVGYIYSSGTNSTQKIVSTKKIDAGMVSDVYMYLTQDMADNCQLVDIDGNSLILATNTRVSVITVSEYSSYVQVSIDGNTYYGWVNNDNLIDTGALPTATIVGLCLLAVAVILTVLTIVIIRTRKHKLVRHE